jgi:GT2 family glycosyltransferase
MMPADAQSLISPTTDLSIVIVSYNTRELLLTCLRSVFEHTKAIRFEIIVVDNDSKDGTVAAVRAQYPGLSVIANPVNRGFSKAVNQALAFSIGRHVLMLNSDTLVNDQALDRMVVCLDQHPDIGAVSCKQWTGDGQLQRSCFPFPSIREHLWHAVFFQRLAPRAQAAVAARQAIDCTQSQDVDWINGACFMVRRDLMEQCGGLDESYFMYFEDIDLCRAIHRRGYRVRHLADADIVHLVGRSSERDRVRLSVEWEFSRIRYVEKHFPPFNRLIMKSWIAAGAAVRLLRTLGHRGSSSRQAPIFGYLAVFPRLWHGQRTNKASQVGRVEAGS